MRVTIQVLIEHDDEPPIVDEIVCLERAALTSDTRGLTLAEAKTVLAQLQDVMVTQQATAYVTQQQTCPHCGAPRRCKGHHAIVMRSLFGKLRLSSPRLYTCACQADDSRRSSSPLADLLPERTTPELRYLETRWAALFPYEAASKMCWPAALTAAACPKCTTTAGNNPSPLWRCSVLYQRIKRATQTWASSMEAKRSG
jgi:hypothetical protein